MPELVWHKSDLKDDVYECWLGGVHVEIEHWQDDKWFLETSLFRACDRTIHAITAKEAKAIAAEVALEDLRAACAAWGLKITDEPKEPQPRQLSLLD